MSEQRLSFGFLLIPYQLIDVAGPLDVLHNVEHENVTKYGGFQKIHDHSLLISQAKKIDFHHIGLTLDPVLTTGNFYVKPTCTTKDCPKLDFLFLGGPDPMYALDMPKEIADFVRARSAQVKTVFATCTGGLVLAACGVLDGKKATVNHMMREIAKEKLPSVQWDFSKNWVIDGKFWSAGGASAGMDMVAHWVKQEMGQELLEFSEMMLEYQPRDIDGKFLPSLNGRAEHIKGEAA